MADASTPIVGELRSLEWTRVDADPASGVRYDLQLAIDRSGGKRATVRFSGVNQLEVTQAFSNVPIALEVHDMRADGWEDPNRFRVTDLEQDGPVRFFCASFEIRE